MSAEKSSRVVDLVDRQPARSVEEMLEETNRLVRSASALTASIQHSFLSAQELIDR